MGYLNIKYHLFLNNTKRFCESEPGTLDKIQFPNNCLFFGALTEKLKYIHSAAEVLYQRSQNLSELNTLEFD
jgi:hypothetical protein